MDPFAVLGVPSDATEVAVRLAWKEKARTCHPDAGGSDEAMQEINEALRQVLIAIAASSNTDDGLRSAQRPSSSHDDGVGREGSKNAEEKTHWARTSRDVSSFTIDCLPVEAFEALLIAASWHGDISIDESPYLLEMVMRDPFSCWIRFDIVPEAGASMVSVSVATARGERPVSSEAIRDVFVDSLNTLNWEDISSG